MSSRNWRRNLLFLWLSQTLIMMAFSFFFPFIPLYVQTLGVHGDADAARWAGLITAAAAVSMAVVQPIWGNLADRFGRKPMVVRSMLAGSIITTLMGIATSPEQLLLLRFIQGAFTGTIAAANALVAASTPRSRLGYALGVMQMSFFLGASVGPLGGGLIADHFGFRMSFYVAGVLMLVGCLIVTLLVHEDFERPPAGVVRPGVWGQSRALLALSSFPILIAITFLIQLGGVIV
ncbi:MAG: MFS transporter, partial [Chloroflexota bacterium]